MYLFFSPLTFVIFPIFLFSPLFSSFLSDLLCSFFILSPHKLCIDYGICNILKHGISQDTNGNMDSYANFVFATGSVLVIRTLGNLEYCIFIEFNMNSSS